MLLEEVEVAISQVERMPSIPGGPFAIAPNSRNSSYKQKGPTSPKRDPHVFSLLEISLSLSFFFLSLSISFSCCCNSIIILVCLVFGEIF